MYDCVNPILARYFITFGRAKAQLEKLSSGCVFFTSAITHCQKHTACVRIVDAEYSHTVRNPEIGKMLSVHARDFARSSHRVNRKISSVALGWILSTLDAASGGDRTTADVLSHKEVGRTLEMQCRALRPMPEFLLLQPALEIVHCSEIGKHSLVPTVFRANRPGTADIAFIARQ